MRRPFTPAVVPQPVFVNATDRFKGYVRTDGKFAVVDVERHFADRTVLVVDSKDACELELARLAAGAPT